MNSAQLTGGYGMPLNLFCLFDEEEFDGCGARNQFQAELVGESLLEMFAARVPALIRRGRIHG